MPKENEKVSLWEKAKAQAKEHYPELGKENPRFWKVASKAYTALGGKFSPEAKKSLDSIVAKCEQLEATTPEMIMDKSLFLEIQKDINGDNPLIPLLQFANYMLEGGRFISKSQGSVDVSSLIPNYEITKSNIISQFTNESSTPIIEMLKAMVSHPHKYLERVKTASGKWRYLYKKNDPNVLAGEKAGLPVPPAHAPEKKEATPTQEKEGKREVASASFNQQKPEDIQKILDRMKTMSHNDRTAYLSKMPTDLKQKIKARLRKGEDTQDLAKAEDKKELRLGEKSEAEHDATMKEVAKDAKEGKLKPLKYYRVKIAKDHLKEFDDYYTRLEKMEAEAKKETPAEKSQVNSSDKDAWVVSRMANVVLQLMNNNPTLEKSQADVLAKDTLGSMHDRGLR